MSNNVSMGVSVTSLLLKTLENATKEYARECVKRCSIEYGFNVEDALLILNLENLRVGVKEMKKRSSGKKEVKAMTENKKNRAKPKEVKCGVRMPFIVSEVKEMGCNGLAYNCGLFTQCPKEKMMDGMYCKTCQKESDSSSTGKPNAGIVADRLSVGLMEYRDPKGRKVIAYSKIMAKDGVDRSTVELEASKVNIEIPAEHFAEAVTEKAGRRKKEAKKKDIVSEASVEDLFASLLGEDEDEEDVDAGDVETVVMSDSEDEAEPVVNKKLELDKEKEARSEMKSEDKMSKLAAEKQAKDTKALKLAAEKEEKAAKLAAEKEEKAAKIAAEKEEKAAKLAAEKEEKALKLAAEKEEKALKLAAEKEEKALKLAAEKEAKKAPKKVTEKKVTEKKVTEKKVIEKKVTEKKVTKVAKSEENADPKVSSEAPKKVTVKRITIEGKQYLKTAENLLYDPETKEEVGIYNEATNSIKALPEDSDDEIEEDGYETDN